MPVDRQINDFASLGACLEVSSAVMTNWKARGISQDGALRAQRVLGCNAIWLLDGAGPQSIGAGSAFTGELLEAASRADNPTLRQAENAARNVLDLDPLPRLANELAA